LKFGGGVAILRHREKQRLKRSKTVSANHKRGGGKEEENVENNTEREKGPRVARSGGEKVWFRLQQKPSFVTQGGAVCKLESLVGETHAAPWDENYKRYVFGRNSPA